MLLLFSEGKVPGRYILFCWPILRETYPVLGPYILFYCLILTGKSGGGIFYDCTTVRILCFFGWKSPWVVYLVPIPLLGDGTFFWRKLFFAGRYMWYSAALFWGESAGTVHFILWLFLERKVRSTALGEYNCTAALFWGKSPGLVIFLCSFFYEESVGDVFYSCSTLLFLDGKVRGGIFYTAALFEGKSPGEVILVLLN